MKTIFKLFSVISFSVVLVSCASDTFDSGLYSNWEGGSEQESTEKYKDYEENPFFSVS